MLQGKSILAFRSVGGGTSALRFRTANSYPIRF
jgi:hypothetical protein